MKNFRLTIVALIVVTLLTSCDHPKTQEALRGIEGSIDDAKNHLSGFAPLADGVTSMTSEQINKLIVYEYKVFSIPADAPNDKMEGLLAQAGTERWECFSVVPQGDSLKVFCRRVPYAALRYLLRIM